MLEVYIPSFSVTALIGVTIYITYDAATVLASGGEDDDVNVYFLWAFSSANFLVDFLSSLLFYLRGKDGLMVNANNPKQDQAPLRTFSLDRQSADMEKRHPLDLPIFNLNMLSALTHVGGDTLCTTSVFVAAIIATAGGVEGSRDWCAMLGRRWW